MAAEVAGLAQAKSALRKKILAARDALPAEQRREAGAAITAQLHALDAWRNARCVLAYMSFGSEFDTTAFAAAALTAGKTLCLPRVDRATRTLALHCVTDLAADLVAGTWGIREPHPHCATPEFAQIDFVLLPGVAFTARCERLGYGGGFYDRTLAAIQPKPFTLGLGFAQGFLPDLEPEPHDDIEGLELFDKVINVDQSPIGRTPRSNPATYTGLFTPIRELMAEVPMAREIGRAHV